MTFIQKIVDNILIDSINQLVNQCYVFPTRRACAFFRHALQIKFKNTTFFAPKILSIQDCATHLTNMYVADDLHLLLELFKVYMPITNDVDSKNNPLTFDVFFPWGQMLIKDFDEIDKYLVNAEHLYSTLFEIREMEVEYNLNEELVEIMSRFREVMSAEQKTDLQEKFLKVWSKSFDVYEAFKTILKDKQIAYEGMIYKEWDNLLKDKSYNSPYKEFIFCGFNALSKVEESIIDSLLLRKQAKIYWDADSSYLEDERQESGMFMRKYFQKYPPSDFSKWIITQNAIYNNTNIELIEIQGSVGQGRVCCQTLEDKKFNGRETALILCDESHLFPTLYGMPQYIEKLNVTMGYSLKQTPLFTLAQTLFDLQLEAKGSAKKTWYRHTSIQNLLNNTYFRSLTGEQGEELLKRIIKEKLAWVSDVVIFEYLEDDWLKSLFKQSKDATEILGKLEQLLYKMFKNLSLNDEDLLDETNEDEIGEPISLEQEMVYHFIKHINLFRSRISQYDFEFELKHLKKIFLESLMALKIPFSGEPLEGVQLMGFLESRVIDFEHVIISGMNEGNIPAGQKNNSFIPYAIRKAYGLPTFEEQDAIYAYHFFRLLQRAKNIVLITDSLAAGSGNAGEASRFYQQVKTHLKTENIPHQLKTFSTNVVANKPAPNLVIEKTEEVQELLNNFEVNENTSWENQKSFSPTAITDYINCPVQFYFKRIVNLKPVKVFEEEIKQVDLGNVVHECLEILYKPLLNLELDANQISVLLKGDLISKTIDDLLRKERFISDEKSLEGKNYLKRSIIERIVRKVLETDRKSVPFTILSLEASHYQTTLELENKKTVRIQGQIDRIDLKDGITRIIDYKTGNAHFNNRVSRGKTVEIEKYLPPYFEKPDFKAGFQAYFYAYLFHKKEQNKPVKVGIYGLKTLGAGIRFLNDNQVLDNEFFEAFEEELKQLLGEIMDFEIPFIQSEEKDRYKYSDFKEIVANV